MTKSPSSQTPVATSANKAKPRPKTSPRPRKSKVPELNAQDISILNADHRDPFSYLGMHVKDDNVVVVRAFLPRANRVWVVSDALHDVGGAVELANICLSGMFRRRMPASIKERFSYRLRVEWDNGAMQEIEDAYRFGPVLRDLDIHLLGEGTHLRNFEKLGAHPIVHEGVSGTFFAVWAPNAQRVSVVGNFNLWDGRRHPMRLRHEVGVWEIFVPDIHEGELYKFEIKGIAGDLLPHKSDPYAFYAEQAPNSASIVYNVDKISWNDGEWMKTRHETSTRDAPISIYEVHLGSWKRRPEEGNRSLTYRELADDLGRYCSEMGFTHIELLPIHEYPFNGSWGYQPIGLYAPTSRFGSPEDFAYFVDRMHQQGVGVIIDWVAGHFPSDSNGLANFDGTALYEHQDPRQGMHKDWNTLIYNYGRNEVVNYLYGNALFWLEKYHVDGLRVDAVASMLYLDYSRNPGEWIPNRYGGNENLEAIEFLRRMNTVVYGNCPGVMTIAEESTAWPMVSRPVHVGGLGFGFKWNMGWMHDTLRYISKDPIHRRYHHNDLTFGLLYAFQENFVLPLSHDEVVHGKHSIMGRMVGDRWQRFANLRAYYAFMFAHPGKKLLFMGGEIAQEREWNYNDSLDWHLLNDPMHRGIQDLVRDLNFLYRETPALHKLDCDGRGFSWIDCNDRDNGVLSFLRHTGEEDGGDVVVVCNFTPVVRTGYRVGVPRPGWYSERLNTDADLYGGSNVGNSGGVIAMEESWHGHPYSLSLTLPPLAVTILQVGD